LGFLNTLSNWFGNVSSGFGGLFSLRFWNTTPIFNDYATDVQKLNAVLKNPAMLKVFALQCDLFSLGRVVVKDKDGNELPDDPAINLMNNPNPVQTRTQFLWDFMFWNMIGNDYCYVDSNVADNPNNKLYFLEVQKIDWPTWLQQNSDKLIFSTAKQKEFDSVMIKYRYNDGSTVDIPLKKILTAFDLTNGLGNWWKSPSRIDALYKVISNSEAVLDAENINIRFSGKFMVAGQADPTNVNQKPMGEQEKTDIEKKMDGDKAVHAVKSMIDIKRFVDNVGNQKLDEMYLAQYFVIGNMYNIPRDVLEAFASSTYENQEKARASHVSYTLQPKGDDFVSSLGKRWGYHEEGKKICMSWAHLPFMQVFEKEKSETEKNISIAFANLINVGVPLDEVNKRLGTDYSNAEAGKVLSSGTLKLQKAASGDQGSSGKGTTT
jgi:hypothetical protein